LTTGYIGEDEFGGAHSPSRTTTDYLHQQRSWALQLGLADTPGSGRVPVGNVIVRSNVIASGVSVCCSVSVNWARAACVSVQSLIASLKVCGRPVRANVDWYAGGPVNCPGSMSSSYVKIRPLTVPGGTQGDERTGFKQQPSPASAQFGSAETAGNHSLPLSISEDMNAIPSARTSA
jgi:hypothetical protein